MFKDEIKLYNNTVKEPNYLFRSYWGLIGISDLYDKFMFWMYPKTYVSSAMKITQLETQVSHLKFEKEQLAKEREIQENQLDILERRVMKLDTENDCILEEINNLGDEINSLNYEKKVLVKENSVLKEKVEELSVQLQEKDQIIKKHEGYNLFQLAYDMRTYYKQLVKSKEDNVNLMDNYITKQKFIYFSDHWLDLDNKKKVLPSTLSETEVNGIIEHFMNQLDSNKTD